MFMHLSTDVQTLIRLPTSYSNPLVQDKNNATIFQMTTNISKKEHQVTFLDTSSNKTMMAVLPHNSKGNMVHCAVGDLKLVKLNELNKHERHKIKRTKFVVYDHFEKQYFSSNPECC